MKRMAKPGNAGEKKRAERDAERGAGNTAAERNRIEELNMERKKIKKILTKACAGMAFSLLFGTAAAMLPGNTVLAEDDGPKIVTTIFPEYDWVMSILGDNPGNADVTFLMDKGVDLHSYQLTADDIMKISVCDLFIFVGGESDAWVKDALKESVNPDMRVIDLLETLGDSAREEELAEGMQEEEPEHQDEEDGPEYDEHVWLSLRNAEVFVSSISDTLGEIDPANAAVYEENANALLDELDRLDGAYAQAVEQGRVKTLLFGDRFPFRYLTDDYGLEYYAAFSGCSAETEASFETIMFLSQKLDELSLPACLTIEGTDHRIAETIVQNTKKKDQKILTMDSMQSSTAADVEAGETYLSVMEKNLEVLREALQ